MFEYRLFFGGVRFYGFEFGLRVSIFKRGDFLMIMFILLSKKDKMWFMENSLQNVYFPCIKLFIYTSYIFLSSS